MPTANEHINRAGFLVGLHSTVKPMSPALRDECLRTYNDMVAEWVNDGLELWFVQADVEGDEVYNDDWSSPAIQYNLAVRIAPLGQVEPPPRIIVEANRLYHAARQRVRLAKVTPGRVTYPGRLPVGSGVTQGARWRRRFYPRNDE